MTHEWIFGSTLLVLAVACGSGAPPPDGGPRPDGGAALDGGVLDGGVLDGGVLDGGVLDGGADAGPFRVVRITPPDGTVLFDPLTEITVEFNRPVAPASVTAANFENREVPPGRPGESKLLMPSVSSPTTVRIETFMRADVGVYNWHYVFTVRQGLRDQQGVALDRAYQATYPVRRRYYYADLGFDGGGGFTHEGPVFAYGTPDGGPGRCDPEGFAGHCWTTGLSGIHYATNLELIDGGLWGNTTEDRLVSPPLDLTGMVDPVLVFRHWYELGAMGPTGGQHVAARVETDTGPDGGWRIEYPIGHLVIGTTHHYRRDIANYPEKFWTGSSGGDGGYSYFGPPAWETVLFDLRPYAGRTIRVSFHFFPEAPGPKYEIKAGWYIDEIAIDQGDPRVLPPLDGGG